jgi:hypothetical protein
MARRLVQIPVTLRPAAVPALPDAEIKAILRGADDLIARGGRTLLGLVLKGSQNAKIRELGLQKSPVSGFFRDLPLAAIGSKIDWLIEHDYLRLEYFGRLPLLVYAPRGWEIERETYAEERFAQLERLAAEARASYDMTYLKDGTREVIMLLLDKVEMRGDLRFIPVLESWAAIDYRKVRARIATVIQSLERRCGDGARPSDPLPPGGSTT